MFLIPKDFFHGMPIIINSLIKYVLGREAIFSITKQLDLLALSVPGNFILNGLMFSIYLTLWQVQNLDLFCEYLFRFFETAM